MNDSPNGAFVSARAVSSSPSAVTFYARALEAEVGVPMSFDIVEPKLSGVEYLLGALASDLLGGFRRLVHRRRLVVDELEAVLKAEVIDTLAYLGVVGESGTPRISSISVKVYAGTGAPEREVRALWEESLTLAPIINTLRLAATLNIEFAVAA